MAIGYIDPFQRGWDRMNQILFKPFDVGKWLVIAFSLWLARLATGGWGGPQVRSQEDLPTVREAVQDASRAWDSFLEHALWLPLIVLIAAIIVGVVLLLVWISSRGKFIFLDNVVRNRAAVVEPFKRFSMHANSLFLWRLGFGILCFVLSVLIGLIVLAPVLAGASHDLLKGLSLAGILFGVMAFMAIGLMAALVNLFLDSFVVPIMYKYDLGVLAAWRHFMPWLHSHLLYFGLYALFVLALLFGLLAAAITLCVFACMTCCLALLLMIPLVGSYLFAVIMLPLYVTYRAFSVEFLAQLDPAFDLFADAEALPA